MWILHRQATTSGSVRVPVLRCMMRLPKNGHNWHCPTHPKTRSYCPYSLVMKGSGLVVRRVFGDIRSPISRCTVLPMVFRIPTLMRCFLQVKTKNKRFGQGRAAGLQGMTEPASVGSRCPLMTNCCRRMSLHSLFVMGPFGSAHHRVWEVTRLLPILGILSQTCRITFATSCVRQMEHFGWRQIRGSLNMTRKVGERCYINPVRCESRSLKRWSQTSNLMGITSGSLTGGLHQTVVLYGFIVRRKHGGVSRA